MKKALSLLTTLILALALGGCMGMGKPHMTEPIIATGFLKRINLNRLQRAGGYEIYPPFYFISKNLPRRIR